MVKSITASLLSMCMPRNPGLFEVLGMEARSRASRAGSFGMGFGSFAMVGENGVRLRCALIQ